MSKAVSIRLNDQQAEKFKRFARRMGKTQSQMGAQLIEESMREAEFAWIEFRDSPAGRQAYMKQSTLAVWEVIMVARDNGMDIERLARYFQRSAGWIRAALDYHESYPEEIDRAIEANDAMSYERLRRLLPQAHLYEVPGDYETGSPDS
ncbi:MAG: transcriptional regulator [Armatimonadetes bacterium]|nr:transcriptional regulator [Armatimonadota bacterium]